MEMSLVNAASDVNLQKTSGAVATTMLKKSLDMQAQSAAALLQAVPEPPRYNNPPGVGGKVDVKV